MPTPAASRFQEIFDVAPVVFMALDNGGKGGLIAGTFGALTK
ncbi:MAG TPA: hypothetical protein VHU83_06925 [Bryobacteraceae bacterium]|nr:hypothetical protein [Bryobacteraceae bacterium]